MVCSEAGGCPFGDRCISCGDISEAPATTLAVLVRVQGRVAEKRGGAPESLGLPSVSCCDQRRKPQLILERGACALRSWLATEHNMHAVSWTPFSGSSRNSFARGVPGKHGKGGSPRQRGRGRTGTSLNHRDAIAPREEKGRVQPYSCSPRRRQ